MKETLSKVVMGGVIFFLIGTTLIWLDIIKLSSVLGYIIGYSLPFVLVLNAISIFFFAKKKEYGILGKQVLNTSIFSIVACLIYLVLISLGIVDPIYSYVFLYIVFPYIFLVILGYILYLAKEKQIKKYKNVLRKIFFFLTILIIAFVISYLFR